MADTNNQLLFDTTFADSILPSELTWLNQPKRFECQADSGSGVRIFADAKSDFWQKTYYEPILQSDNGHLLYYNVTQPKVVMETSFDVSPVKEFDQAGLMVYLDTDHWIKTGLEYVDGAFRLSCVVTNVYSDWSCQPWSGTKLSLRLWKIGESYVVENKHADSDEWTFIRIAHLNHSAAPGKETKMGVLTAAPTDAGTSTLFKYLKLKTTTGYSHHNN